ncbi:MAG: UTP--glucose-1-phosphate uridylyltransferase [Oscillospiraceae bacterium]|jgi:UTP--glucose-1-phosphate uridylyltransferase|nr:UTP--glucose-1-phosphate uridylyltransferase [Oscillospiraceae bacterium]
MKITKAVIPAAGFGTRVLPATKAIPKEMFPLVEKPAIQHIVEEAVASGIKDILIVTNRGKNSIEEHFDRTPELESHLEKHDKLKDLEEVRKISKLANVYFLRQKELKGLGHAVYAARDFVGKEPFAVLYGDDVITSKIPVCGVLAELYYEFGLGVVGVGQVPRDQISKYSSVKIEKIRDRTFRCNDMIEKPKEFQVMSFYAILGRCILPYEIFKFLENAKPGAGGEIQLTDAMKTLARNQGMIAFEYEGTRHDIGSKLGFAKAFIHMALESREIGKDVRDWIINEVK